MTNQLALVSTMTEHEFAVEFIKLAKQLGATDADELTIRSYYDVLSGCDLGAIRVSARAFAVEKGRKYLPKTSEWYEGAQRAQGAVYAEALEQAVSADPSAIECEVCDDTGWARVEGLAKAYMGVTKCGCRGTNATYLRKVQKGRV